MPKPHGDCLPLRGNRNLHEEDTTLPSYQLGPRLPELATAPPFLFSNIVIIKY